jgi:hypothetical protein
MNAVAITLRTVGEALTLVRERQESYLLYLGWSSESILGTIAWFHPELTYGARVSLSTALKIQHASGES